MGGENSIELSGTQWRSIKDVELHEESWKFLMSYLFFPPSFQMTSLYCLWWNRFTGSDCGCHHTTQLWEVYHVTLTSKRKPERGASRHISILFVVFLSSTSYKMFYGLDIRSFENTDNFSLFSNSLIVSKSFSSFSSDSSVR